MYYLKQACFIFILSFIVFPELFSQTRVKDIEGNIYRSVIIGSQVWMVENLRATKFNDGVNIPNVVDEKEWVRMITAGYSWYDNDITNKNSYGGLYNFYAVVSGKLCPEGWRVPTDEDWIIFLGNFDNHEALRGIEEKDFQPLPGGYRYGYYWGSGSYHEKERNGYWWTATPYTATHIWTRTINFSERKFYRSYFEKNNGFSVRCIKCDDK